MNCVTIKSRHADGLVTIEMFDTDTNGMGGHTVCVPDLWRWLWKSRPCQVRVRDRIYSLQQPTRRTGQAIPGVYRGGEN